MTAFRSLPLPSGAVIIFIMSTPTPEQPVPLSPEEMARIRAEEAYRAQVRAEQGQARSAKRAGGCWAAVSIVIALALVGALALRYLPSIFPGAGLSGGVSDGELMRECEQGVKERLNYPDEAEFVGGLSVGANKEISRNPDGVIWSSTVKTKNAFGVQSSIGFTCIKTSKDVSPTVILSQ